MVVAGRETGAAWRVLGRNRPTSSGGKVKLIWVEAFAFSLFFAARALMRAAMTESVPNVAPE